jgi:hypothetical protein
MSPVALVKSNFNTTKFTFKSPSNNDLDSDIEASNYTPAILKKVSKQAKMMKNKALLNEMGFRAELDFKPINLSETGKEVGQLYSIQVTDFWGNKEKIKFLKEQGYWEAYKQMISDSNKSKLYYSKTFKHPVAPKVLDITTSRKVQKTNETSINSSFNQKAFESISPQIETAIKTAEGNERLCKIHKVEYNCTKLAKETKSLKKTANEIRNEISRKFETRSENKHKLSRYEISKIKKHIDSFR